ncbi:hypothetical protein HUO13_15395 [Saccharopolyspora erythraea]|uniref:hypothetical protein n=1 Tax=Saccharopolyspora erythraea TaxID=1836 RepID=UPI001BAE28E6|nr:hypothetical protein [Saccharopolyspora erythraea]QUH02000.1 hypothetical protein HUO13_15395 [Saccharopolyspora erythraea]
MLSHIELLSRPNMLIRLDGDPIQPVWSLGTVDHDLDGAWQSEATRNASHFPRDPERRIAADQVSEWIAGVLGASGVRLCAVQEAARPTWWVVAWQESTTDAVACLVDERPRDNP